MQPDKIGVIFVILTEVHSAVSDRWIVTAYIAARIKRAEQYGGNGEIRHLYVRYDHHKHLEQRIQVNGTCEATHDSGNRLHNAASNVRTRTRRDIPKVAW